MIDGEFADTTSPAKTAEERERQAADQVRAAWAPERAERVLACTAWPVLANQLNRLQEQGYDVAALLHGVPDFVDRAHTPAAFAYRSIDDRLDGLVDLGTDSTPRPQNTNDTDIARAGAQAPEQGRGDRPSDAVTAEQIQAAGIAYWGQQHLAARAAAAADPARDRARDERGHTAQDRALFTLSQMNAYQRADVPPGERLAGEDAADRRGIVAQLQAGPVEPTAAAQSSPERAGRAVDTGQDRAADAAAAGERGDGAAARIAAQGYPVSTQAAVGAARSGAGTAAPSAGAVAASRSGPEVATGEQVSR